MFGDLKNYPKTMLGNIASLITKGASPSWQGVSYTDDNSQTLFITSENVLNNALDLTKLKYVENKINDIQPRSILQMGDILVNIVGASIGRVAEFNLKNKTNINQAVCLLRIPDEDVFNKKYLLYYMNSEDAMKYYLENQVSVARANLSLKNINDMDIPTPPIELQNQFADFVKHIDKLKFRETITKLKNLCYNIFNIIQSKNLSEVKKWQTLNI